MCAETLYLRLVAFMRIIKQIFPYYMEWLYCYCVRDLDIWQNYFLWNCFGLMPSDRHSNKFYAYLFGIIRNACFNIQIIAKLYFGHKIMKSVLCDFESRGVLLPLSSHELFIIIVFITGSNALVLCEWYYEIRLVG